MQFLNLNECLGISKVDKLYHVTASEINPQTGKAYAVRPDGIWDDNYFAQNFANKAENNYGHQGATASPQQLADQQRGIFQEAIKPAITSLEASRPEVNTSFDTRASQVEASKDPLKARYQKLIDDITGRGAGMVTDTTRVAAQEMGRRGIPLSSTSAQEETLRRTQPIQQATTSEITDVSLDREEKLRGLDDLITNLTQEKVAAQRDITNTIAQIQASAGKDAAQAALQMYQIQQSQREAALDRAITEKNAETARITATAPSTEVVTVGGRKKLINKQTGAVISDLGSSSEGGSGNNIADIFKNLGIGNANTTALNSSAHFSSGGNTSANSSSWEIVP